MQDQRQIGKNLSVTPILRIIDDISGIINVIDYRVFNKVNENGLYSSSEINQVLSDSTTKQIDLLGQNTLFARIYDIFELKYINRDIKIRFAS
jgi:hypothetical protein